MPINLLPSDNEIMVMLLCKKTHLIYTLRWVFNTV